MPDSRPQSARPAAFPRSFLKSYPVAVRGEGVWLWDAEGNKYLDFAGGAAVTFIGHGVAEVAEAMAEQARTLAFVHSSQFTTGLAEQYARELLEFAGEPFRGGCVYFCSGGSEAVETAIKLARQYQVEVGQPQRDLMLSRYQSYHGATLGALAVSGNVRRRQIFLPLVREFPKTRIPYCYRCGYGCEDCARRYADEVAQTIDATAGRAAAFFFEPVSGATLGAAVPPKGYLERVAEICRERGVLTVADEVMTGCGRTGRNFAVEHWGVAPDMITAGKAIASGYAPLAAVLVSRRVVEAIASGSGAITHGLTYNAHPVSLAAGRAVLRRIREQRLVSAAAKLGDTMRAELGRLLDLDCVGDVRGIGLLWGVEFVEDKATKRPFPPEKGFSARVGELARKRGVLTYPMQGSVDGFAGDHLLLAPPAVIRQDEIAWAAAELRAAIEEAAADKR